MDAFCICRHLGRSPIHLCIFRFLHVRHVLDSRLGQHVRGSWLFLPYACVSTLLLWESYELHEINHSYKRLFVFWAITLGFLIASIAENPTLAAIINPMCICILILFAGLMQTVYAMPRFWSAWMYWLSKFYLSLDVHALILTIECVYT